jgi:hypothetical protein
LSRVVFRVAHVVGQILANYWRRSKKVPLTFICLNFLTYKGIIIITSMPNSFLCQKIRTPANNFVLDPVCTISSIHTYWESLDFCPSPESLKRTKKLFSDYGLGPGSLTVLVGFIKIYN